MNRVTILGIECGGDFSFASLEETKSQYERIKTEILAGKRGFEISDTKTCEFFLVEKVCALILNR